MMFTLFWFAQVVYTVSKTLCLMLQTHSGPGQSNTRKNYKNYSGHEIRNLGFH